MVKNPNRFSVAEDLNKGLQITIQLAVRAGLELATSELQVRRSNHSTTPPLQQKGGDWLFEAN